MTRSIEEQKEDRQTYEAPASEISRGWDKQEVGWELNFLREGLCGIYRPDADSKELYVGFVECWEDVAPELERELPAEDSAEVAQKDEHCTVFVLPQRGQRHHSRIGGARHLRSTELGIGCHQQSG